MAGGRDSITVSVCLFWAARAIMFPNLRLQVESEFLWPWILLQLCTLSLTQVLMQKRKHTYALDDTLEGELKQGIIMCLLNNLCLGFMYAVIMCCVMLLFSTSQADHHWSMSNPSQVYTCQ